MDEKIKKEIGSIYLLTAKIKDEFNSLFRKLKNREYDELESIDITLKALGITINDESRYALVKRIVTLKEDSLSNFCEGDIRKEEKLKKAFEYSSKLHIMQFKTIQKLIIENETLNEFYRTFFDMYIEAGELLTLAQPKWKDSLAKVESDLLSDFGSDEAILKYLNEKNLFDLCEGKRYTHCYSLLQKQKNGSYKSFAYIDVIPEIEYFVKVLSKYRFKLEKLEDDYFDAKESYINYIDAMILAFSCRDTDKNIELFRNLDRVWMSIDTPIQPTHPFEYYEDKYRSAVALEFDLRISNPYLELNDVRSDVIKMYNRIMDKNGFSESDVKVSNLSSLNDTQLHLSKPIYYFGAQFDGLFSAQVIPNDVLVTKEFSKKIFASIDYVYELQKSSPELEISHKILPKEFLNYNRDILHNKKETWYNVYNISTIGHEFGHILYVHGDNEVIMNKSGSYKNVEEFKATTGGLVAYFNSSDNSFIEPLFYNLVSRAVGLISWMEVDEVRPYYTEGLIHLDILFNSGILEFNSGGLIVDMDSVKLNKCIEIYREVYNDLALHYLNKKDSLDFLLRFTAPNGRNYLPKDETIKEFVNYYHGLYKKIGNQIYIESLEE